MEFELWWLLGFPLFFALGWLAARIDIKQLLSESRALPMSYFKGLNFLLNEQQDKAIEAFIELVKVDPQTVELHFALGSLFRRRGEVERAIRMHENLLDRPDLGREQRLQALYELAQDYLKAGLLDRAEELFGKLAGTQYEQQGLKYLLEIYEQEGATSRLARGVPTGPRGVIKGVPEEGVVLLTGRVPGHTSKRLAGVIAWWIPGVRDVINNLAVYPPEDDGPDMIAEAVRVVLEKDPFVDASQVRVVVTGTTVGLLGLVPSEVEKEAAKRDAWCTFGVDDVLSTIEVHP